MSFWSVQTEEPLRQFRWYMNFSTDLGKISYALKKADKPKAKISTIQHKYINHYFNYPGRLEWEDINVTFAAVAEPNGSKILFDILTKSGYGVPSGKNTETDKSTIGKNKMNSAIGTIDLIQIDPDGNTREKWQIYKPLFTSVQFGALDYGSEEIVEITCTLKYDWAKLNDFDESIDLVPGDSPGFPEK